MTNIRFKRGNKADLPKSATSGTPLWCEDTKELYVGTESGVQRIGTTESELNNKVAKSGDTMTNTLNINVNSTGAIHIKPKNSLLDYTSANAPTSTIYAGRMLCCDKNNQWFGTFESLHHTNNNVQTAIGIRRSVSGVDKSAFIIVGIDVNGNIFTSAPTPAKGDNSSKIATTAFVQTTVQNNYINNFPNYSGEITVSSGYVAPKNGYIMFQGMSSAGNPSYTTGYIDGKYVWDNWQGQGDGRAGAHRHASVVPIAKGQKVTITGAIEYIRFFPCKGNV